MSLQKLISTSGIKKLGKININEFVYQTQRESPITEVEPGIDELECFEGDDSEEDEDFILLLN